jgi:recombination protein RecR
VCHLCASSSRDETVLCVVETPADVWVVDQSAVFRGKFFVLHGRLSPLDGIGPDELGFDLLAQRLTLGLVKEIILATNATVEGEATAHFISEMARRQNITATRIAHGVPMGGELEYIDGGTLAHAFNGRREL